MFSDRRVLRPAAPRPERRLAPRSSRQECGPATRRIGADRRRPGSDGHGLRTAPLPASRAKGRGRDRGSGRQPADRPAPRAGAAAPAPRRPRPADPALPLGPHVRDAVRDRRRLPRSGQPRDPPRPLARTLALQRRSPRCSRPRAAGAGAGKRSGGGRVGAVRQRLPLDRRRPSSTGAGGRAAQKSGKPIRCSPVTGSAATGSRRSIRLSRGSRASSQAIIASAEPAARTAVEPTASASGPASR